MITLKLDITEEKIGNLSRRIMSCLTTLFSQIDVEGSMNNKLSYPYWGDFKNEAPPDKKKIMRK